jgi:AraC-like DNA-binding protein/mannose-6-phosphate isomerase-like protein (cupin superfamily)
MDETLGTRAARHEPHTPEAQPDRPTPGRWRLWLPDGVDSGVHAEVASDPSGLVHAGENWVSMSHEIPWHAHVAWEFYLQLHGGSTWDVEGQTLRLAPGWLVAVPPETAHHGVPRAREGGRHHFVYVAVDLEIVGSRHPSLAMAWHGQRTCWSPWARDLAPIFRSVVSEVSEQRPFGTVALTGALDLLLSGVTRSLLHTGATHARAARHPAVGRARQLLDHEYAEQWTVESLAAACSLSRARFAELFTAEVGQPPYAYLLERRVERAAEMLATTPYTVSEVAAQVGFSSHVQLARRFRQVMDMSPSEWRRHSTRAR